MIKTRAVITEVLNCDECPYVKVWAGSYDIRLHIKKIVSGECTQAKKSLDGSLGWIPDWCPLPVFSNELTIVTEETSKIQSDQK